MRDHPLAVHLAIAGGHAHPDIGFLNPPVRDSEKKDSQHGERAEHPPMKKKAALPCRRKGFQPLCDGGRFAEMFFLHGDPSAPLAHIFHGTEFLFAHVFGVGGRRSTEGALALIAARVAQMTRIVRYRTTILAGVSHRLSPFH